MGDETGVTVLAVSVDGVTGVPGRSSDMETTPLRMHVPRLLQRFAHDRRERRRGLSGRTRQSIASMKGAVRSTRNGTRLYIKALRRERIAIRAELADSFAEYARVRREERVLGRRAAMDDLASYVAVRQQDARRLQARLVVVRRALEEENHDLLEKYARERRAYAQVLRSEMGSLRQKLAVERTSKGRPKGTPAAFGEGTPEHSLPSGEISQDSEMHDLKMQVLEVIGNSPDGISLTGIGSCMFVEWRKLIRPAKELLEEGLIRKENLEYFPGHVGPTETREESEDFACDQHAPIEAETQAENETETRDESEDCTFEQQFSL